MAEDITIYVEEGQTSRPAEPPQTPRPAEPPANTQKLGMGDVARFMAIQQAARQVYQAGVSNIAFVSGNSQLQEQVETGTQVVGIGIALIKAPILTATALAIKTGVDVWQTGIRQGRAQYKAQQEQELTGKILVNGGRY